jgi:hypothetical protein
MEVFSGQDGLAHRRQLRAVGVTDAEVDWALAHGDLVSVRRGVLAVPGIPLTEDRHQRAALLACPDAVLSHRAAAGVHKLPHVQPGALEITVPRRRAARLAGVTCHTCRTDLAAADLAVVGGLACTSVARTVVDLAHAFAPGALRSIVAHAERTLRPRGIGAIRAAAGRVGPMRRPEVASLIELLDRVDGGEVALDLTPNVLAALRARGLPEPALEVPVTWCGEVYVCDLAFVEERVDVEIDDDFSHATAAGSHRDKERDRLARRSGWEVERAHAETDLNAFADHVAWLLAERGRPRAS